MRLFAALLGLTAFVSVRAQEGPASAAPGEAVPARAIPMAVMPGESGLLLLREGGTLKGRLLATGPDGDVVELDDERAVRLRAGSVVGIAAGTGQAAASTRVEVDLLDGRVLRGRLASRDAESLTVEVDGSTATASLPEVRAVRLTPGTGTGPSWLDLPSASGARIRTLQAPTAFRLEQWEGVFSATGLAEPTATLGVTSFAMLSVEGAFPTLYGQRGGESLQVAADAGLELVRFVHVAAGLRAEFQGAGIQGWLYGALTAGTPGAYMSLYTGPPPVGAVHGDDFGKSAVSLAGGVAVLPNIWLLAESWFSRGVENQISMQGGAGARLAWSFFFFELGVVGRPSGEFPVWVSLGVGGRRSGGRQP